MNFSRLRLGIGLAALLSIASVTAGFAQTGPGPAPLPPPPTPSSGQPAASAVPAPAASPAVTAAPTTAPTATPVATPSPGGPRRGRRAPSSPAPLGASPAPSPSDTPEPPQFTTLDGIWEVQLQPMGKRLAVYTHFSIAVTGAAIKGYWEHDPRKMRSPMTGTFDGRLISMTITMPDGTTPTFSGYVENFADMVGLYRTSDTDAGTAFTAQHRKKLKI